MVDKKFGDFQWDFSSQTGSTSCAPDQCACDQLGCSSPGKISRRNMVISRKKMAYQRVGTTSSKASPPDISRESKLYFNSYANGQHSGFGIFEKNGGNQESENDYTVKRDLGNINLKTDHNYCGVPTQFTQQSHRLEISFQSGLIQMGPLSTCSSQSLPEVTHQAAYVAWKLDPYSIATDAMPIPWTQGHCYAFLPFCLIPRVLSKIQQDQVHTGTLITGTLTGTPSWQTQLWYPQVLGMLIRDQL